MVIGFKYCVIVWVMWVCNAREFIRNGGLSTPNVSQSAGRILAAKGITEWSGVTIELGLGGLYNSAWGKSLPIMSLDTGINQAVTQLIYLPQTALYVLSFFWAAREEYANSSSGVVVINGKAKQLLPLDNSLHYQEYVVVGTAGNNLLLFQGTGTADGFGLTISQISMVGVNLVINGDFAFPQLQNAKATAFPQGVLGWVGGVMTIAAGEWSNPNWSDIQILALSANGPQNTSQIWNSLKPAPYVVIFNWAVQTVGVFVSYAQQKLTVLWNGVVLQQLKSIDAAIYCASFNVTATGIKDTLTFAPTTFAGAVFGIAISNVVLRAN